MNEAVSSYVEHYLKTKEGLYFLLVTFVGLLLCIGVIFLFSHMVTGGRRGNRVNRFEEITDSFFELIFSGGSILFFMAAYYLINRFYFVEPWRGMWDKYKDFMLLLLIIISILFNRLLDNILIRLHCISHNDKSAIRLVSMVYMMLIFGYIKFIYENDNYDMFITYFLGLMIGRFAYFDVSWADLRDGIAGAIRNLPIMVLALAYLGGMAWYGFKTEYLIKHIGVVTNVFFIHLFMFVAIAVVFYIYRIVVSIRR